MCRHVRQHENISGSLEPDMFFVQGKQLLGPVSEEIVLTNFLSYRRLVLFHRMKKHACEETVRSVYLTETAFRVGYEQSLVFECPICLFRHILGLKEVKINEHEKLHESMG